MRRITTWLLSTVTIVVLLFGYHTSTNRQAGSDSSNNQPASTAAASTPAASSSPSAAGTSKTSTGAAADTRWGPVQVAITTSGSTITEVTVLQSPSGNPRDVEINDQALPVLVADTLKAQSADIDMVSGATVTSEGYLRSLQSALDEAGI